MPITYSGEFSKDSHSGDLQNPRCQIFAESTVAPLSMKSFANSEMELMYGLSDIDIDFDMRNIGTVAKGQTYLEVCGKGKNTYERVLNGPDAMAARDPDGLKFRINVEINTKPRGMFIEPSYFGWDEDESTTDWQIGQLAAVILHEVTFHVMDYVGLIQSFRDVKEGELETRPTFGEFHGAMKTENVQHGCLVGEPNYKPNYLLHNYRRARARFWHKGNLTQVDNKYKVFKQGKVFDYVISKDCDNHRIYSPTLMKSTTNLGWWKSSHTADELDSTYYLPDKVVVSQPANTSK